MALILESTNYNLHLTCKKLYEKGHRSSPQTAYRRPQICLHCSAMLNVPGVAQQPKPAVSNQSQRFSRYGLTASIEPQNRRPQARVVCGRTSRTRKPTMTLHPPPDRGGWGKLAGGVKWPPPPVRQLTKEDEITEVSSHLSLLELTCGQI